MSNFFFHDAVASAAPSGGGGTGPGGGGGVIPSPPPVNIADFQNGEFILDDGTTVPDFTDIGMGGFATRGIPPDPRSLGLPEFYLPSGASLTDARAALESARLAGGGVIVLAENGAYVWSDILLIDKTIDRNYDNIYIVGDVAVPAITDPGYAAAMARTPTVRVTGTSVERMAAIHFRSNVDLISGNYLLSQDCPRGTRRLWLTSTSGLFVGTFLKVLQYDAPIWWRDKIYSGQASNSANVGSWARDCFQITAIGPGYVDIDQALTWDFTVYQRVEIKRFVPLKNVGVQNIRLDWTAGNPTGSLRALAFERTWNSFDRNVWAIRFPTLHYQHIDSTHHSAINAVANDPWSTGGSGNGYAINLTRTNRSVAMDCAANNARHVVGQELSNRVYHIRGNYLNLDLHPSHARFPKAWGMEACRVVKGVNNKPNFMLTAAAYNNVSSALVAGMLDCVISDCDLDARGSSGDGIRFGGLDIRMRMLNNRIRLSLNSVSYRASLICLMGYTDDAKIKGNVIAYDGPESRNMCAIGLTGGIVVGDPANPKPGGQSGNGVEPLNTPSRPGGGPSPLPVTDPLRKGVEISGNTFYGVPGGKEVSQAYTLPPLEGFQSETEIADMIRDENTWLPYADPAQPAPIGLLAQQYAWRAAHPEMWPL